MCVSQFSECVYSFNQIKCPIIGLHTDSEHVDRASYITCYIDYQPNIIWCGDGLHVCLCISLMDPGYIYLSCIIIYILLDFLGFNFIDDIFLITFWLIDLAACRKVTLQYTFSRGSYLFCQGLVWIIIIQSCFHLMSTFFIWNNVLPLRHFVDNWGVCFVWELHFYIKARIWRIHNEFNFFWKMFLFCLNPHNSL